MSKKLTIWHNGVKKMSFVITEEQSYNGSTMSPTELFQSHIRFGQNFCTGLYCEIEDLSIADHDKVIACIHSEKERRLAQIQNEQDKRQLEIQF